jgi:hypothetical protein
VNQLAVAEHQADILAALRRLKGKATVGDVVAATGLKADDARAGLKALLEGRQGHLAVSESGELLYDFHPSLIERGTEPLLARLKRTGWSLFQKGFKAWIVIMLVVYFVVLVALVLAALFAQQRGGGDRRDGGIFGGGGRSHGSPFGNFWLWYWLMGNRWPVGRPYYGRRWEQTLGRDERVPFYKKVFAFVFGPDQPRPDPLEKDREVLRLVRARKGVLSTAELVQHTALTVPAADDEMGRLVAAYDGEPVVSPGGELAYAFPDLMVSAHGSVREREPKPAWQRLEHPKEVTGNDAKSNALVAGINGFNLVAAATAPWFIFPRLGMGGTAAFVGLVLIPVIYSLMFFAVPAARTVSVRRENRKRERRNIRKVLLGLVYEMTLDKGAGVMAGPSTEYVARRLDHQDVRPKDVERALQELAAEFDADVEPDADGQLIYRFPKVREQVTASEALRRVLELDAKALGPIVFNTGDSPEDEGRRELEAFDRALAETRGADLGRYVPSPGKVGFEDEWALSPAASSAVPSAPSRERPRFRPPTR